jgi:beta,beta-carotene 9',10'-dioxygenase
MYALGFQDMPEQQTVELAWEGRVPGWLQGSLFRNGPGRYDRGQVEVNHWFDGLALLHAFGLSSDKVLYHSRFVRSQDFRASEMDGQIASPGFACDPCRSLFRKIASAFVLDATDNPNVNLVKQGDKFLALTELPIPMVFDPDTLRSVAPHRYCDSVPPGSTTAHPHQQDGFLYNQVAHYSARSSYRLYRQYGLGAREEFASVPVDEVSYVHSFGMSQNHMVLTCCPLQVAPWKLLLRDKPFIENFEWKPRFGTRFHVIPRVGRKGHRCTLNTEPFFLFHHVNSFEQDGQLKVDLIAYPNADIIQQLKLENLRGERAIDFGYLRRYAVDLQASTIEREWESEHPIELTRLHYSRVNTRAYKYLWGVSASPGESVFYDRLLKLDVSCDRAAYWHEPETFPGEPIFVAAPDSDCEDNGVLLSVVLSGREKKSYLLVLDAKDMTEIARAWLPGVVPHGFHGLYEGNSAQAANR